MLDVKALNALFLDQRTLAHLLDDGISRLKSLDVICCPREITLFRGALWKCPFIG